MISIISCIDLNAGIGFRNRPLVVLEGEKVRFKELVKEKIVVMGRKTLDLIVEETGSTIPNCINIVLTEDKDFKYKGVFVYNSLESLVDDYKSAGQEREVLVVGGSQVYKQFIPYANTIHLTLIHHHFDYVDSYFPDLDGDDWEMKIEKTGGREDGELQFSCITYKRMKPV